MKIKVVLYDDNLQPSSIQEYEVSEYLEKLSKRIFSILYLLEENKDKSDVLKFITKIYYQMNAIDELASKALFLGSVGDVKAIAKMIDEDVEFEKIKSLILETGNNLRKLGGV